MTSKVYRTIVMVRDVLYEGYPSFGGRSNWKGRRVFVYCQRRIETPDMRQRFPASGRLSHGQLTVSIHDERAGRGRTYFLPGFCRWHCLPYLMLFHSPAFDTPPERIGRSDRMLQLSTNSSLYSVFYASCYVHSIGVYRLSTRHVVRYIFSTILRSTLCRLNEFRLVLETQTLIQSRL